MRNSNRNLCCKTPGKKQISFKKKNMKKKGPNMLLAHPTQIERK